MFGSVQADIKVTTDQDMMLHHVAKSPETGLKPSDRLLIDKRKIRSAAGSNGAR